MRPAVPEGDCDGKHRTRMLFVATVLTLQIQTIKIDNEHPGEDSCSPTDQVAKMSSDEKAAPVSTQKSLLCVATMPKPRDGELWV
jgi:hypothetical protein